MPRERGSHDYDVFISVRDLVVQKDAFTQALLSDLRLQGFRPYFYKSADDGLSESIVHENHLKTVEHIIGNDACKAFVLICSEDMGPSDAWQEGEEAEFMGLEPGSMAPFNPTQREIYFALRRNGDGGVVSEAWKRLSTDANKRPLLPIIPVLWPGAGCDIKGVRGVPIKMKNLPWEWGGEPADLVAKVARKVERAVPESQRLGRLATALDSGSSSGGPGAQSSEQAPPIAILTDWEKILTHNVSQEWRRHGGASADKYTDFVAEALRQAYIPLVGEGLSQKYVRGEDGQPVLAGKSEDKADASVLPMVSWLSESGPRNLFVMGASGAGKSTFLHRTGSIIARALLDKALDPSEEPIAAALQRQIGGAPSWPVPLAIDARKFVEKHLKDLDPDCAGVGNREKFEAALCDHVGKGADVFLRRLEERPYLVLLDGLDQVDAAARVPFIDTLMSFADSFKKVSVLATVRAVSESDARQLSDGLSAVIRREAEGWEIVRLQPLSPDQVSDFCDAIATKVAVPYKVKSGFSALMKKIKAKSEARSLVETPFMLTLAAFYAQTGENADELSGAALVMGLIDRVFQKFPAQRNAVGAVGLALVSANKLEVSQQEFAAIAAAHAPPELDEAFDEAWGEKLFESLVTDRGLGFFRRCERASGPLLAIDESEDQGEFIHALFRDVMVADYMLRSVKRGGWRKAFQDHGIKADLLEGGRRWREPLRVILEAVALVRFGAGSEGAEVLENLLESLREAKDSEARKALLGLLLSVPEWVFSQLGAKGEEAIREVEASYQGLRAALPVADRLSAFERLGAIVRSAKRDFPEGVRAAQPYTIGLDRVEQLWVANAPVLVRDYALFIDAMQKLDRRAAEQHFTLEGRVPASHRMAEIDSVDGRVFRAESPLDYAIDRHSPAFWERQRARHANRPVVGVTWVEAMAYCAWLTRRLDEGDQSVGITITLNPDHVVRLPTLQEWRAVAKHLCGGDRFIWGSEKLAEREAAAVNWARAGVRGVAPVGFFPPRQGVFDFGSNVSEWGDLGGNEDERKDFLKRGFMTVLGANYSAYPDEMDPNAAEADREKIWVASPSIGFRWVIGQPLVL